MSATDGVLKFLKNNDFPSKFRKYKVSKHINRYEMNHITPQGP